ncbi:MAG: sigma-54 dependent transcriptional regulator [Proteobacteria bacterium]|nr:sigma-54 dependent transcriptional regulator [Pseudomonadota bacterium]MBU1388968.1 sigma-54 dependent transcriptional regulator [Pseudomonadota bacterium]MBU1543520.1 sigma-54 dependent transcriptional regulator [Pseudomonadota bacterium]MBU2431307.1 sigma-54 dependent transcriptional regulator [Pseudomonadota bacterium]MBU2480821.1 sigma-54 dependent transcriptional regulator [Pseudomonadota bacterium]
MPGHRILIILENPKERMAYARFFEDLGFLVDAIPDGSQVFSYLKENKTDLVISDVATPGLSAVDFLKKINENNMICQVLFLSQEPVLEHAVNLMKLGALDYLVRPVELEQLHLQAKRAFVKLAQLAPAIKSSPSFSHKKVKIIAKDEGIRQLLTLAARVADSSASVLIQGESGTGKELFAKYIHEKSGRHNQPFIAVNCAALPENLLESELFGHEKGAFTGAISRKIGKFELAHKGTLFLDEITEMQFHLQAKLLRVLQEKVVDRVGGIEPVEVDVRVIATTNRDAKKAVEDNDFREDLFHRLNTIPLVIPPLRDRKGDLDLLCEFFIQKYCKIDGRNVKGLTTQAARLLQRHSFSGNVRELENIIHRAVLLADSEWIIPENLMIDSCNEDGRIMEPFVNAGDEAEPVSLKTMEQKMIYKTLDQTEGNRTHAAKILGISVRTLRNKLHEYKDSI